MKDKKKCSQDADERPLNCTKCGKFMASKHWIGENSNECEEHTCVCGHSETYL